MLDPNNVTAVYTLDPLRDPRWPEFLQSNPAASVFHTPNWLEALRRTYGYQPTVFTTSSPDEQLKNGIVLCRAKDWWRGCRMVSVPFSDHCQPLLNTREEWTALVSALTDYQWREKCGYIEIRPLTSCPDEEGMHSVLARGEQYSFHTLDLRRSQEDIFNNFHKSCVQRKIHRAERENLSYEAGWSESLLDQFYRLLLLTRRRHQLPPQPLAWFRNLRDCLGDKAVIRVASKDGQAVASILTLSFKNSLIYKYGCSDARYHNLGGMPLLFWKGIQAGKAMGADQFDLGRSEADNPGLATFKEHLGAAGSPLVYLRIEPHPSRTSATDWKIRWLRKVFSHMPTPCLKLVGDNFYRYMG